MEKKNILWLVWLVVSIILCVVLVPLGVISFIALAIAFPVHISKQRAREYKEQWNIPETAKKVSYLGGYGDKLKSKLYVNYDGAKQKLELWEASTGKNTSPKHMVAEKDDIIAFSQLGEFTSTQHTQVKGGGASIGGAIVGNAIAGPVGAVIGGRKKVKTKTTTSTSDTRRTLLKFRENGIEKSVLLDYSAYGLLSIWIPEKNN